MVAALKRDINRLEAQMRNRNKMRGQLEETQAKIREDTQEKMAIRRQKRDLTKK